MDCVFSADWLPLVTAPTFLEALAKLERMLGALGSARILDAARQTLADAKPPSDLGQQQDAGVRGEAAAIEGGVNRLTGNR